MTFDEWWETLPHSEKTGHIGSMNRRQLAELAWHTADGRATIETIDLIREETLRAYDAAFNA